MNRTQLACYCLTASAMVLAVLLVAAGQGRFSALTTTASAEMAMRTNDYAFLLARTRSEGESLFVIDKPQSRLLIYELDVGRKRLTPLLIQDLEPLFNTARLESRSRRRR